MRFICKSRLQTGVTKQAQVIPNTFRFEYQKFRGGTLAPVRVEMLGGILAPVECTSTYASWGICKREHLCQLGPYWF